MNGLLSEPVPVHAFADPDAKPSKPDANLLQIIDELTWLQNMM